MAVSPSESAGIQLSDMPIVSALMAYARKSRQSLHVPGHKDGRLFPAELGRWFQSALRLDATELPGLDNLQQPEGCIAASQELARSHFGADATLYSVSGSSGGILAAVFALTGASDTPWIVVGPAHQSVWRAMVLADAVPVMVPTGYDPLTQTSRPPTAALVRQALLNCPKAAGVFITSPSYTGGVAPVAEIAEEVHRFDVPLVVDEAHGAHFGLHPDLPQHSIAAGADVVIQSVHKMLPALTQTAWIHVKGPRVDKNRVAEALATFQTTSPSYLLLASLDAAQAWVRNRGCEVVRDSLHVLNRYELTRPKPDVDPFRIWLPTPSSAVSHMFERGLADQGTMIEYANPLGILCMFGLQVEPRDVDRLIRGLKVGAERAGCSNGDSVEPEVWTWPFPGTVEGSVGAVEGHSESGRFSANWTGFSVDRTVELQMRPREVARAPGERVPLRDAEGRIAAVPVVPYPPGTPVVFPGELLSREVLAQLKNLVDLHVETVGLWADGTIKVCG